MTAFGPSVNPARYSERVNKKRYISLDEKNLGLRIYDDSLFKSYETWAAAHDYIVTEILKDPMAYFDPSRYLQEVDRWIAAPCYIATTTNIFNDSSPLLSDDMKRIWGVADDEGQPIWQLLGLPKLSRGKTLLAAATADLLSVFIWQAYLFWSPGMLSHIHEQVAAKALRLSNPKWEILLL